MDSVPHTVAAPRIEGAGEALSLIRDGRASTIGELAQQMDLARSTVSQRVDRLVEAGLVIVRRVDEPAGRGRPPTILTFNPAAGIVLVAHLGMTGARVAATELDGAVRADRFVAYPLESGPAAVRELLADGLDAAMAEAGRDADSLRGIGVGVPHAVELTAGLAPGAPIGPSWRDFAVGEYLSARYGVPTFVDNDVNLLALGEHSAGWANVDVLLCLKVGSVIGCGTVVHGRVVRGAQGMAGELGHIRVAGDRTPCACGNFGCLDAVASGRVLAARLRAAGLPVGDARDVAALAARGVPAAVQAVREAGRAIGAVLAGAVNLLNPGVIAVWGYLAEAEEPLFAGLREGIYQHSLPAASRSLRLVPARLGDSAGLAGAAMMVVSHILAPDALDSFLTRRLTADRTARLADRGTGHRPSRKQPTGKRPSMKQTSANQPSANQPSVTPPSSAGRPSDSELMTSA